MQIDALRVKAKINTPQEKQQPLKKLTPEERIHLRNIACFKCRKPGHVAKECPVDKPKN